MFDQQDNVNYSELYSSSSCSVYLRMSTENLPPFFPLNREGCEKSADDLFKCLDEKSEPRGSSEAARQVLRTCAEVRDIYTKCIRASLDKKGVRKPIVLTEWES